MNRKASTALCCVAACASMAACEGKSDPKAEAPPPAKIERVEDRNVFEAEKPEQFALVTAGEHLSVRQLKVTGTVAPDISRSVPVVSLATGRVISISARLGDTVKKGQLLLQLQSADLSAAFSDYRKAIADEQLTRTQFDRAKLLYDKGAISLNDRQVAEDADAKAKVDVENTKERVRVLGGNLDHASAIVEIHAPISGVITDQQVTNAGGVGGLGSPNPFTISDLSRVWILCDVLENDLASVRVGEKAEIRLNAYASKVLTGVIGNIGAVLDPNLRTAKVRVEVNNPGILRPGMFVTSTFFGKSEEKHVQIPATAVLHLHDQDWVYEPIGGKKFRRVSVTGGNMLPNGMQEVLVGLAAGDRVVSNALEFQNAVEQ